MASDVLRNKFIRDSLITEGNIQMKRIVLFITFISFLVASSAWSANLVYEDFDYALADGESLVGGNNGFGFSDAWNGGAYSTSSLPFPAGSEYISNAGALMVSGGSSCQRHLQNTLNMDPASETTYYVSLLIKYVDPTRTFGGEWFSIKLSNPQNYLEIPGKGSRDNIYINSNMADLADTEQGVMGENGTYLIVVKIVARSGQDDTASIVYYGSGEDVVKDEPANDLWDAAFDVNLSGAFDCFSISVGDNIEKLCIDEIRVGETWEDAVSNSASYDRIPSVPFDRGLVLDLDASHVYKAYDPNQLCDRAFNIINQARGDYTFGGTQYDGMPKIIPDALNGHSVFDFDGENDGLLLSPRSYMSMPKVTVFMVLKLDDMTTDDVQVLFRHGYSDIDGSGKVSQDLWGIFMAGNRFYIHSRSKTGSMKSTTQYTSEYPDYSICNFWWDGCDKVVSVANGDEASKVTASGADGYAQGHLKSTLGENTLGGSYFDGKFAKILVYNRVLTPAQRSLVGAYLTEKYGLTTSYPAVNLEDCEDVWRNGGGQAADLNQDCQVGIDDLVLLSADWLKDARD